MINEIKVNNISIKIGKKQILNDITFSVSGGEIVGIVGENGAGKTVLYKIMSGIVKPDRGVVVYNGKVKEEATPNIGIMMDDISLYSNMTVKENLKLLAEIRHKISDAQIDDAIRRVGLEIDDERKFKKLSLGQKHRAVLAQAIMEKPDFLFLDEPTNGLDQKGRELYFNIVKQEADRGACVLVTSHNENDIDNLIRRRLLLKAGRIIT